MSDNNPLAITLSPGRPSAFPRVLNRYTITSFDEEPVYIGRPSKWQNPFPVTAERTREKAIEEFERWVLTQPQLLEDAKRELKGRNLLCFCTPRCCHGDFWLKLVNAPVESPVRFDHYRLGQSLTTWGYHVGDKDKPLSLETLVDRPLYYCDTAAWWRALDADKKELYRIDFTVRFPQVLLQQAKDWRCKLWDDLTNYRKVFDAVVFVPLYRPGGYHPRKGVLLNPRQQITAITKITP